MHKIKNIANTPTLEGKKGMFVIAIKINNIAKVPYTTTFNIFLCELYLLYQLQNLLSRD